MLGLAIGAALGAVVGHFLLIERLAWKSEEGTRDYLVETGHAAHALIALYALTNLDVLLARIQLSAFDAGLYASGALVARAVFLLPQAILVAAFPRIVAGACATRNVRPSLPWRGSGCSPPRSWRSSPNWSSESSPASSPRGSR